MDIAYIKQGLFLAEPFTDGKPLALQTPIAWFPASKNRPPIGRPVLHF